MKLSKQDTNSNIFCSYHKHILDDSQPNVLTLGVYTQDHSQPELSYNTDVILSIRGFIIDGMSKRSRD
jgi:hypothetical protein